MEIQIKKYSNTDRLGCINAFKSNVPMYFTNEEIQDFEAFLTRLESDNKNTQFYVINYTNQTIGCGEKLFNYRIEQIKLLEPKFPVIIDTTQYSYGFFEKYGFKVTKITNDYYEIGMHRYDMILET